MTAATVELEANVEGSPVAKRAKLVDRPRLKATGAQLAAYRCAYAHFNRELFAGTLPEVLIHVSRHGNTHGAIALKAEALIDRPARDAAGVLVQEMCHVWQHVHGSPPSQGWYHDRQWAEKMKAIGLYPSSTGAPGGREVGARMRHYVIEEGAFARAFLTLPDAELLAWRSAGTRKEAGRRDPSKVKYTCPRCGANAWGKAGLALICGNDGERFVMAP